MNRPCSLAARVYLALLRAYPQAFRDRFATGMVEAFVQELDAARARGPAAAIGVWVAAFIDAVRFGCLERVEHARQRRLAYEGGGLSMRSVLFVDIRDAWRSLRATPLVTAVAVLSLALGIGANTALFTILNSLVLKSLPVRDPGHLAILQDGSWTNPIWEQVRDRQDYIGAGAFAWANDRFDLSTGAERDYADGAWASGGIFDVLGVVPMRGRMLTIADDVRGGGAAGPVAVISYSLWQRRFGGADDVVGRRISIERVPFTIVGVTPPGYFGPDVGRSTDVTIPLGTEPLVRGAESALDGRSSWWIEIMVRLRPGESVEEANLRLRGLQPQIRAATMPSKWRAELLGEYLKTPMTLVPAASGRSPLRDRYVQPLTVILAVVALVLLIACANIASLLLARAVGRRHEFSVRLALGASRWRLSRQLLAESLLLSGAGAALGLAFAHWASRALVAQLTTFSRVVSLDLTPDWRVLAFTTGVTVLTGLAFGLAPALGVSAVVPNDALKQQGRGIVGDRRMSLRNALVVMQVALSLVLVVAAALFGRTFHALTTQRSGFDRDPVLVVEVDAQRSAVSREQRPALFERLRDAAAAIPGVSQAAVSFTSPVGANGWNTEVADAPASLGRRERMSWINAVSPGWFETYGVRLVAGRDVSTADPPGARMAVVNRTFAERFMGGGNPVGRTFRTKGPSGPPTEYEVIGLVEDAVYRSLRAGMMPTIYIPLSQWEDPGPAAVVGIRSAGAPPLTLARSALAAITANEGGLAVSYHSLTAQVNASLTQERLLATLSVFFGGLALLLAGLGLYGLTSYSVNSRRTEIGIRLALGADPSRVVWLVVRRVAWLVGLGVFAGAAIALWVSRFVSALLYNLEPWDPPTFASAAVILALAAALAAWRPARRASRTDPTIVLRES